MNGLLSKISQLFTRGQSTEFEIRLLEKEAHTFLSRSTTAAEGYMALGLLAVIRLDQAAMEDFFSKSLHLMPDDPLILSNYAKVQHALGHAEKALQVIERSMRLMNNDILTSQAVHVALSALHIQQALDWQNELENPIISVPEAWLSAHMALLEQLNVEPMMLTTYRDRMAVVLVNKGFLVDRGWVSFKPGGVLDYTFMLKGSATFDISTFHSEWERMIDERLCQIVFFKTRLSESKTGAHSEEV